MCACGHHCTPHIFLGRAKELAEVVIYSYNINDTSKQKSDKIKSYNLFSDEQYFFWIQKSLRILLQKMAPCRKQLNLSVNKYGSLNERSDQDFKETKRYLEPFQYTICTLLFLFDVSTALMEFRVVTKNVVFQLLHVVLLFHDFCCSLNLIAYCFTGQIAVTPSRKMKSLLTKVCQYKMSKQRATGHRFCMP